MPNTGVQVGMKKGELVTSDNTSIRPREKLRSLLKFYFRETA